MPCTGSVTYVTTVVPRETPPRGRRSTRPTGEDRQRAILSTAERLLAEKGLDGFSIDELARGAGLSRPTFYFYFASKDAVVLSLLDRMIDEAERAMPVIDLVSDPVGSWRSIIQSIVDVFAAHRAVTAAAVRAHTTSPEIRELWAAAMQRWVDGSTRLIRAERRRGAAPKGQRPRDLAVALNLMNERVLVAAFTDEQPSIAEADVTDVLLTIWLSAIYGSPTGP